MRSPVLVSAAAALRVRHDSVLERCGAAAHGAVQESGPRLPAAATARRVASRAVTHGRVPGPCERSRRLPMPPARSSRLSRSARSAMRKGRRDCARGGGWVGGGGGTWCACSNQPLPPRLAAHLQAAGRPSQCGRVPSSASSQAQAREGGRGEALSSRQLYPAEARRSAAPPPSPSASSSCSPAARARVAQGHGGHAAARRSEAASTASQPAARAWERATQRPSSAASHSTTGARPGRSEELRVPVQHGARADVDDVAVRGGLCRAAGRDDALEQAAARHGAAAAQAREHGARQGRVGAAL